MGSFSAASNVTGVREDVDAITMLLHRHGALSFWDYAASAPHTEVNVSPAVHTMDSSLLEKDAVFIRCTFLGDVEGGRKEGSERGRGGRMSFTIRIDMILSVSARP